jgi:hypothetical protein
MADLIVKSKDGNFNETYRDMEDDTLAKVVAVAGTVAVEGVEFSGTVNVVASGPLTDHSDTITTGGVAQDAMAVNSSRKFARLKNPDTATEDLYYSFTGTASASSDVLHAGDEMIAVSFVPTQALSVFAATTAHAFVAEEG